MKSLRILSLVLASSVSLAEATGQNRKVDQEMLGAAFGILEDVEKEAVAG